MTHLQYCISDPCPRGEERSANLKKALYLSVVVPLILALVSCGSGAGTFPDGTEDPGTAFFTEDTAPGPEEAPADSGTDVTDTPETDDPGTDAAVFTAHHPLTRAELDSLPVADASMTEDELRDLCLDFFIMQASFQWTPSETLEYSSTNSDHTFLKGRLYGGLPYSQASSNLYSFLDYYDETTGIFDVAEAGPDFGKMLGNDCADALFWAWARVSDSISFKATNSMVPSRGCIKLGDVVFDEEADSFKEQHTKTICANNGKEVMYAAYALLEKADGMVTSNGSGHARMVMENHPFYSGTEIDGEKSYVLVAEQHSTLKSAWQGSDDDGAWVEVVGGIGNGYTYANLFEKGYIPVTIAEFTGEDPVEEARAYLDPLQDDPDLESLLAAEIVSNYRISKVTYSFIDGDEVLLYGTLYGRQKTMYRMPVSDLIDAERAAGAVAEGRSCFVTICALVGTGQTVPVFDGTVRF